MLGESRDKDIEFCRKVAVVFAAVGLSSALGMLLSGTRKPPDRSSLPHLAPFDSSKKPVRQVIKIPKAQGLTLAERNARIRERFPADREWASNNPPLVLLDSLKEMKGSGIVEVPYVPTDWVTVDDAIELLGMVGDTTKCNEVVGKSTGAFRGPTSIGYEATRMLMHFVDLGRPYPYCRPNADERIDFIVSEAKRLVAEHE
jgi:hypothetical protein